MISTNQFRKGLKIEINGEPYNIVDFQHVKPGKGNAFIRTRLKSMISGNVLEKTFKSGEKVGKPDLENKKVQYLYRVGDDFNFMDMETYDQNSASRRKQRNYIASEGRCISERPETRRSRLWPPRTIPQSTFWNGCVRVRDM